ncbi:death domain-associated protein 6-like [Argonauta hians]
MSEEVFEKFLGFLDGHLENKEFITFVKKRYNDCSDSFRLSEDFLTLLTDIQSKIETEKHRIFVHLKSFVAELKSYRVTTVSKSKRKLKDIAWEKTNKRQCISNSCSDLSSDSDFFKKNNEGKNNEHKKTAEEQKNENSCRKGESIPCKKNDKPSIVDESLSNDSVRSESKSSDSLDFPVYFSGRIIYDSKNAPCLASSSNHKSVSDIEKHSSPDVVLLDGKDSLNSASDSKIEVDLDSDRNEEEEEEEEVEEEEENSNRNCLDRPSSSPNVPEESVSNSAGVKGKKRKKGSERQIKRLEELLSKISKEIETVNEKELGLEELEDEDSAYLYEDRLQKKFVKVWEKLCELKNQDTRTGRPVERKFHYNGTRYPEINKRIEKFINRRKIFPDYFDIKHIINQVNNVQKLFLGKTVIDDLAREAFTDVGNQLQERRHRDFILTFGNRQTEEYRVSSDPAFTDKTLKKKLDENRKLAKTKLDDVISKYAQKQYETNAQPEEVDENELESSSEEEEEVQEIPELDEVMALDDDDEDDDNTEFKIDKPSGGITSPISHTKDLKVQLEKLVIPPKFKADKNLPDCSVSNSCVKTRSTPDRSCKASPQSKTVKGYNNAMPLLPLSRVVKNNLENSKEKVVIDLDDSSSESEENGISCSIPSNRLMSYAATNKEQSLVPLRSPFALGARNSNSSLSSCTATSSSASSSSSTRMLLSSQSNMQVSMEVKTQVQQQQNCDGVSLKIASVASLAYSLNNKTNKSQYFTAQQTNIQSQNYQMTSSTSYGIKHCPKWPTVVQSKEVIVLSDSD